MAHYARASDGRTRLATDDQVRVIDASGREFSYSVLTRTALIRESVAVEGREGSPLETEPVAARVLAERELGRRQVEGLDAHGRATTVVGCEGECEIHIEEWRLSDHQDLLVESYVERRYRDGRIEGVRKRLYGLELGEPDAALFGIPEDYEVRIVPDVSARPSTP